MTLRPWKVTRAGYTLSRHFTQRGAALKMREMKRALQKCSDRLSLSREYDHFRDILTEMGDTLGIERSRR